MSFLTKLFKNKKETIKKEPEKVGDKAMEERPRKETRPTAGRGIPGVLVAPHITEKTTKAAEDGKYVFLVAPGANKIEIKKSKS